MTRLLLRGRIAAAATLIAAAGAIGLLQACSRVTEPLLEVQDPDLVVPGTLQNAEGANALYVGAIGRLRAATVSTSGIQEPSWLFSGLLADEWSTSSTFIQNDEVDQRNIKTDNTSVRDQFRALARARTAANQALDGLRAFLPNEKTKMAEMYFIRGFAEMQMAQDYCNGIPLSDAAGAVVAFGTPLTVAEVFNRAIASYDSALALAAGTDTSSVRIRIERSARVGKARALLGVDKAAEAAALLSAALVPTAFEYEITHSVTGGSNAIWGQGASARRYTVSDSIEGNARNLLIRNVIPFFSLQDPRLPVRYTVGTRNDTTKSQDGFTFSRTTTLYGQLTSAALVNGLDARLIEAEARLQAGDHAGMITILNALRAAPPKLGEIQPTAAQLPPLAVPLTQVDAENLYFREKAFWTFSRGQRLGDLRRLIRQYDRTAANTFPVGTHYRGGEYGTDVNLPVPKDEEKNNPNIQQGCIDRLP